MSSSGHPRWETLFAYATGALAPGASLIVASHCETCRLCAGEVGLLEGLGGALLEGIEPTETMSPGALQAVLRVTPWAAPSPSHLPAALSGRRVGPWRWAGPGLRKATVAGAAPGERLYLMRGTAGARLPTHGHRGPERLLVLSGAFADQGRVFGPGDFVEADQNDEHCPEVRADCLCLVATDGRLRFGGIARWLQPALGV